MKPQDGALTRVLVGYFGLAQAAHFGLLVRAAVPYLRSGEMPFPALPPEGGWSQQAEMIWVGMGLVDALFILVSLVFVYGYFAGPGWQRQLGLVSLTGMVYSAALFGVGTLLNGAWAAHPLAYLFLALAFAPVGLLFGVFATYRAVK